MDSGNLFIVAAPSGAGKTCLVHELLKADDRLRLCVSYTTRSPRLGERHGQDYFFVSDDVFQHMQAGQDFLESALVYGSRYGTSRTQVSQVLEQGLDVLLEIDWQGARQVKAVYPEAVGVFIFPPSMAALAERLNGRGKDDPAVIARRLAVAREDLSHFAEFDYVIINRDLDVAVQELLMVVHSLRLRPERRQPFYQKLVSENL